MDNIFETAQKNGNFTTLVKAIQTAGMEDTLKSGGPFTCLAPTDEAFSKVPQGTIDALMKDKDKLATVLKFHTLDGKVMSRDLKNMDRVKTLAGEEIKVDSSEGLKVGEAMAVQPDIEASNGVIHVIDRVMIPQSIRVQA